MHDDPTEHTCPHGSRPIDERCDACWREENEDPIDFAMLTPPTRPGPCKAATAPEADPAERRLERERETAAWEVFMKAEQAGIVIDEPKTFDFAATWPAALEVKHGSGKVKV